MRYQDNLAKDSLEKFYYPINNPLTIYFQEGFVCAHPDIFTTG
jgi:hypothetical protein